MTASRRRFWGLSLRRRFPLLPRRRSVPDRGAADPGRGASDVPVLIINLDRDAVRLDAAIASMAGQPVTVTRIWAVPGLSLPRVASGFIPGAARTESGTLGCFLSHLRAWETVVDSTTQGAVILEDDAEIRGDLRAAVAIAAGSGADLVFINYRMALPQQVDAVAKPTNTVSLGQSLLARAGMDQDACGSDGYYLTRRGATILLDLVDRRGVLGDVDWVMVYAALGNAGIAGIRSNATAVRCLGQYRHFYNIGRPLLEAAALDVPVVYSGAQPSSRLAENGVVT
jgi:GR25 family glycosyltransferase involved in LPS biosynthesis